MQNNYREKTWYYDDVLTLSDKYSLRKLYVDQTTFEMIYKENLQLISL